MKITRREMLQVSAGTGAALFLNRFPVFAQSPAILTRTIPSSGEVVPAVGLGSARTFNVGESAAERAPLKEVLRLFRECRRAAGDRNAGTRRCAGEGRRVRSGQQRVR